MLKEVKIYLEERKNTIGMAMASIIVVYVIYKMANMQTMMIENLENNDSSYKNITEVHKNSDIQNKEKINIKEEEETHYQNLAALHDRVSSEIAVKILNNKDKRNKLHEKDGELSDQALDIITQINALHNFRDAIESTMDFVEETNKKK